MWTNKAYIPHLLVALLMIMVGIALSLSNYADHALDVDLHDSYYVINYFHALLFMASLSIIQSIPYIILKFLKRRVYKALSMAHFISSLCLMILLCTIIFVNFSSPHKRYYDDGLMLLDLMNIGILLLFAISTLLAILNPILSKKRKDRN